MTTWLWDHDYKGSRHWALDDSVSHAYHGSTWQAACADSIVLMESDFRPFPPEAPLCPDCATRTGVLALIDPWSRR